MTDKVNKFPKTIKEAYKIYMEEKWYNFYPFDDVLETSFLDILNNTKDNPYKLKTMKDGTK